MNIQEQIGNAYILAGMVILLLTLYAISGSWLFLGMVLLSLITLINQILFIIKSK